MWEELACVKGSLFSPPLRHGAFGGSSDLNLETRTPYRFESTPAAPALGQASCRSDSVEAVEFCPEGQNISTEREFRNLFHFALLSGL